LVLLEFNRRFFVTGDGDKCRIMRRIVDDMGLERLVGMDDRSFVTFTEGFAVEEMHGGKTVEVPQGLWWLRHPKAERFDRMVFDPTPGAKVPKDVYNRFRGFGFTPDLIKPHPYPAITEHIRRVLANDDPEMEKFILDFIALMLQRPQEPAGVALVLKGGFGSGKSSLGRMLRRMIGPQSCYQLVSPSQLVGKFNAHLGDIVCAIAEEALFAGDNAGASVLKSLITDQVISIERKGRDAYQQRNCLHIVMMSNEDWVLKIVAGDRRYVIAQTWDGMTGNREYFDALYAEIDGPALAGFFHDLQRRPLPPRLIIPTESAAVRAYRNEQQIQSLGSFYGWLYGRIAEDAIIRKPEPIPFGSRAKKDDVYQDYIREMTDIHERYPHNSVHFSRKLLAVFPDLSERKLWAGGERSRMWQFPSWGDAATAFEQHQKTTGLFDRLAHDQLD
jgi:hypothetical protein